MRTPSDGLSRVSSSSQGGDRGFESRIRYERPTPTRSAPPDRNSVKPWERIARATTPEGGRLDLVHHDGEFVIRAQHYDLMTSHAHGSEAAMLSLALPDPPRRARVLVGGLGMGYTLGAALELLPEGARVVVSELLPEVVEWNRGPLAQLAGRPLEDPRTEVVLGDVAELIGGSEQRFDAILLDVDNGPRDFTQRDNERLYTPAGLAAARSALRPGGALAVWSVGGERSFERSLRAAGFRASTHVVAAHRGRGSRYLVFVGRRR